MGQRIPVTLGNIAPLSLRPFQPDGLLWCAKAADNVEFSRLACWMSLCARSLILSIFISAHLPGRRTSAYICNQPGYARKVIMRYTTKREFFDPLRFVRGGNLIDPTGWWRPPRQMPLQMDTAARLFDSGKSFYMCACRQDDYAPNYFAN